jgi:hypothetical protein
MFSAETQVEKVAEPVVEKVIKKEPVIEKTEEEIPDWLS